MSLPSTIPECHEYLLARLLAHRASHDRHFTFSTRRMNDERFRAGYWFQGAEDYIFCAPFKCNENKNRTKTIGLVLGFKKGKLVVTKYDIVFGADNLQAHVPLYRAILELFGAAYDPNQLRYEIKATQDTLEAVVDDFCGRLVPAMAALIKIFGFEKEYMVSENEFAAAMRRIEARKQAGLVPLKAGKKKSKSEQKAELVEANALTTDLVRHGDDALTADYGPAPRNVIFHGPPGTGKTHTLIEKVLPAYQGEGENERFELVTFHPSYSYEDFVEGLRPVAVEQGDGTRSIEIQPRDGALKRLCNRAKMDPDRRYALIMDEVNRGNIAKIFGELITLVEADKRVRYDAAGRRIAGLELTLPCTGERFGVPDNVDFYGTMNTADRSIALVDLALRRRFLFRALPPDVRAIQGADGKGLVMGDDGTAIDLRLMLRVLNARLTVLRGPDSCIGQAYFTAIRDFDGLRAAFRDRILPLLQEYFFDELEGAARVLAVKKGAIPFMEAFTPRIASLFGSTADMEELDEQQVWRVTGTLPAASFRALYEGVPRTALEDI